VDLKKTRFLSRTRKGYQIPRGSHAFTHGSLYKDPDLVDMCYVFGRFEERTGREENIRITKERGGGLAGWMILPRWKAIKDLPGVLPIEDWREILKAHRRYTVVPCICRADDRGRQCDTSEQICMTFDRGADRRIDVAKDGKDHTLKEMLDFIDGMAKEPVVSLLMGSTSKDIKDINELLSVCNCHWDCCLAMMPWYLPDAKYGIGEFLYKTRFRATVDPEKCIGCRRCVDERCQFWAAQMKYYPEFGEERAYIDEEKCVGCGLCVETCPVGCKGMKIVEPPEYILEIPEEEGIWAGGINIEGVFKEQEKLQAAKEVKEKK